MCLYRIRRTHTDPRRGEQHFTANAPGAGARPTPHGGGRMPSGSVMMARASRYSRVKGLSAVQFERVHLYVLLASTDALDKVAKVRPGVVAALRMALRRQLHGRGFCTGERGRGL